MADTCVAVAAADGEEPDCGEERPSAMAGEGPELARPPWDVTGAASYGELWSAHSPGLKRLCMRWMSGHADSAEEAFSRAALVAFEKYPRQREKLRDPGAWLRRLTYNVCMDLHRELGRRGRQLAVNSDGVDLDAAALWSRGVEDPERKYLRAERWAVIVQSVGSLSAKLRVAMALVLFEDRSYREVARRLEISEAALRKRIQEARRELRRRVALYAAGKMQLTSRRRPVAGRCRPGGEDGRKPSGPSAGG